MIAHLNQKLETLMNLPFLLGEIAKKGNLKDGVSTLFTTLHHSVNDVLRGKLDPEAQKQVDACFVNLELNTNAVAGALGANLGKEEEAEVAIK